MRISRDEFDELFDEMLNLPARDICLQLPLPRLLTPELAALRAAIDHDDHDDHEALVDAALTEVDDPMRRAELARAVLALAEAGRVERRVAAVAVIDLAGEVSALLRSSLLEALAVSVGAARTPSGLLVVSR